MIKICLIELGYIGLPTATFLANKSYKIHGVDVLQSTIDTINRRKIHIVGAYKFILAIPTAFYDEFVPNIHNLKANNIIILESTSPVDTTNKKILKENHVYSS